MLISIVKGIALLVKWLPGIATAGNAVQNYIKPEEKYNKNRIIFVSGMFLLLFILTAALGEVDTIVALDALERFCDIIGCD